VLFCYELEVALSWALITSIMAVAWEDFLVIRTKIYILGKHFLIVILVHTDFCEDPIKAWLNMAALKAKCRSCLIILQIKIKIKFFPQLLSRTYFSCKSSLWKSPWDSQQIYPSKKYRVALVNIGIYFNKTFTPTFNNWKSKIHKNIVILFQTIL
jgi:hypothetical protein